jgi:hypothetical protein
MEKSLNVRVDRFGLSFGNLTNDIARRVLASEEKRTHTEHRPGVRGKVNWCSGAACFAFGDLEYARFRYLALPLSTSVGKNNPGNGTCEFFPAAGWRLELRGLTASFLEREFTSG